VYVSLPKSCFTHQFILLLGGIIIVHEKFTHMMDVLLGTITSYVHAILCGILAPVVKHLLPNINAGDLFCKSHC